MNIVVCAAAALALGSPGFLYARDLDGFSASLAGALEAVRAGQDGGEAAAPAAAGGPEAGPAQAGVQAAAQVQGEAVALANGPTFRIVSWNVRTFGKGMKSARREAYEQIAHDMLSGNRSVKLLSIQEVSTAQMAEALDDMLPGDDSRWNVDSGIDSRDGQDNFFYTRQDMVVNCSRQLFSGPGSRGKSLHPARIAHVQLGDLDFTIINLHLTFGRGRPEGTRRELKHVLDWLVGYLKRPDADPDVVISGDYNLPTEEGKRRSARSGESGWHTLESIISEYPEFRVELDQAGGRKARRTDLVPLVHDRTSRSEGAPANNYDHFILTGDLFDEEYVEGTAGVVSSRLIEAAEAAHKVYVSDHLPISIGLRHGGTGNDGQRIRLDGSAGACSR